MAARQDTPDRIRRALRRAGVGIVFVGLALTFGPPACGTPSAGGDSGVDAGAEEEPASLEEEAAPDAGDPGVPDGWGDAAGDPGGSCPDG